MKGLYIAPELEIVKFLNEDILTATSLENGGSGSGFEGDDGEIGWEEYN